MKLEKEKRRGEGNRKKGGKKKRGKKKGGQNKTCCSTAAAWACCRCCSACCCSWRACWAAANAKPAACAPPAVPPPDAIWYSAAANCCCWFCDTAIHNIPRNKHIRHLPPYSRYQSRNYKAFNTHHFYHTLIKFTKRGDINWREGEQTRGAYTTSLGFRRGGGEGARKRGGEKIRL